MGACCLRHWTCNPDWDVHTAWQLELECVSLMPTKKLALQRAEQVE